MIVVRVLAFLLLFSVIACKQKQANDYEKSIIGEWVYVQENARKQANGFSEYSTRIPVHAFSFLLNNVCERRPGYFDWSVDRESGVRKTTFLGSTTRYEIKDDTLRISNHDNSAWMWKKIVSITADTMTLQRNGALYRYKKARYRIDKAEHFDEIIVSNRHSGCFGSGPVNDILIRKNGQVIFCGERYNLVNGCFASRVDEKVFSKIENDFKKANIENLKYIYHGNERFVPATIVTFVRGDKIVKTVRDYDMNAPEEFYWAYTSLSYLYQRIPLHALDSIPTHLNHEPYSYSVFERGEEMCRLSESEGFYLWSLLASSHETQEKFVAVGLLRNTLEPDGKDIKTDGRFFKYMMQDGSEKTYDIGFNFLQKNGLDQKFGKYE